MVPLRDRVPISVPCDLRLWVASDLGRCESGERRQTQQMMALGRNVGRLAMQWKILDTGAVKHILFASQMAEHNKMKKLLDKSNC